MMRLQPDEQIPMARHHGSSSWGERDAAKGLVGRLHTPARSRGLEAISAMGYKNPKYVDANAPLETKG
jgi:hypothetical protein